MLTELPPLPRPAWSNGPFDDVHDVINALGEQGFGSDQMTAYGQACQAAALATVTPLVQQMMEALDTCETPFTCGGPGRDFDTLAVDLAGQAARAFLSGATRGEPS